LTQQRAASTAASPALSKDSKVMDIVKHLGKTNVTTLNNGLRVATETNHAETATVGVWIDTGSRYEDAKVNGVAHFLEHMAFKGTGKRSRVGLETEIENMGGALNAYTSRAHTAFYAKVFKKDVPQAMDILSDILRNSKFSPDAVEAERGTILREMQEIENNLEEVVFDRLHETAYRGTALGRTILGPAENIKSITRDDIVDYVTTHYTAPRMVIAGAGAIEHKDLVQLAEKHFGDVPSHPKNGKKVVMEPARFTGSHIRMRYDEMEDAHVALAFPVAGQNDPDNVTLMLMQSMLGGWNKEITAGHGKHSSSPMISMVASEDLASHLMTFLTQYQDTGLFGVYTVCPPVRQRDLFYGITREITRLCYECPEERLFEAKNQVKVNLLTMLDGTTPIAEDIGRQLLAYGRRLHPAEMMARIDAVDPAQVKQTANRYFYDRDHALAAIGPIYELPDYNYIRRRSYWIRY